MAFNIHITRIGENTVSGDVNTRSAKTHNNRTVTTKQSNTAPSLINVPADRMMNKYPVRIFELQTQE
jgi:hypothetical protein